MSVETAPIEMAAWEKAIHTGKMANTLAKALASKYSKRWQFTDFLGPEGRESAGIVDILAIRKSGKPPKIKGLKKLDLFEVIVMQVKGGSAPEPTASDISRLRLVAEHYHSETIVLYKWKKQEPDKSGYFVLSDGDVWIKKSAKELFGT